MTSIIKQPPRSFLLKQMGGETLVTGKITYDGAADKCLVHHGAGGGVCLAAELPLLIGVGREKRWLHVSVESIDKGIAVGMAELMDKDGDTAEEK